jgi:sugar phosphate isomerase/epimerase
MIQTALQLYTIRSYTARNMLATIRQVAAIGYPAVELAGLGDASPRQIRHTLDDCGMLALGAHIQLTDLLQRRYQILADMQTIGCPFIVVPWVATQHRQSPEAVQRLTETLNQIGVDLKAEGFQLAYHNHDYEFQPLAGSSMWEILVNELDPQYVAFELDLYWAQFAGYKPLDLIESLSGQIPLIHFKDMAADHTRADVPLGMGIMPWKEILAACDAAGTRWAIVEQDHPRNPMADVQMSLAYMREITTN